MHHDPPVDPDTHALALRLARACRHVVQACLREEEWADADREFYAIIFMGLARQGEESHASADSSTSRTH
jgi:hypothetical protein